MSTTSIDNRLRQPVEYYSALVTCIALILIWRYPRWFALSNDTQPLAIGLCLGLILLRGYQGLKIQRYQWRLYQSPQSPLKNAQSLTSNKGLFLGYGFHWQPRLTERLRQLDELANAAYHPFKKQSHRMNDHSFLHQVSDREYPIYLPFIERGQHLLVLGTTGVGKTRLAELLISQDIRHGNVVIVLDPKGDVNLLRRMVAEADQAGRRHQLQILHLGFPEVSVPYNPIGQFTRITEVANRIANQLPGNGNSAAFKEFGWQFINVIAQALVAMGRRPTYQLIDHYIMRMDQLLYEYLTNRHAHSLGIFPLDSLFTEEESPFRDKKTKPLSLKEKLIAFVKEKKLDEHPIINGLLQACQYDGNYYSKITASLGPLLKKLTTGRAAALLSPSDQDEDNQKPLLNWRQAIRQQQIVYVGLDALTDHAVATAVGNALLNDLVSLAGRLYNFGLQDGYPQADHSQSPLPKICLHADEFNDLIGPEFIPLLNKARGAGFQVTAYTQTWSDVEARLQDPAKAGQVMGNFNTLMMFRVKEAKTAHLLLDGLPTVTIPTVTQASSVTDEAHHRQGIYFKTQNEDRLQMKETPLLTHTDILNLPKGHAWGLLQGGQVYKLRIPLLPEPAAHLPQTVPELVHFIQSRSHLNV